MALLLVPLIGALGMAVEGSSWLFTSRAAQNAADSAAVAAANNGSTAVTSSHYQYEWEAWANAKSYGFDNGSNATVTVSRNVACPDGTSTCYSATVTQVMPIYLTRMVGFNGDTDLSGGRRGTTITSTAVAESISSIKYPSCLTATGNDSGGNGVQTKGAPFSNMAGCTISATGPNSQVSCNGQGIGGNPSIFATSSIDSVCSNGVRMSNRPTSAYTDPYANYYQNIPCSINGASTNCASGSSISCAPYSGSFTVGNCYTASSGNTINISSQTLSPGGPGVVYIQNANVSFDNVSLVSSNVTFVFTGTTPGGFTGGKKGSLDITAPQSGTWSGVGAYQDTHLATSTWKAADWSQNGNGPTVDIMGLMYLPRTDVSFGGGAGGSSKTSTCYVAVYHSYDTNGTGISMTRSGCPAAGLNDLPTIQFARAALVQ
jgi:Flp pilus assembly protein TadG